MLDYNVNNHFCKTQGINSNFDHGVVDYLCKSINNNKY